MRAAYRVADVRSAEALLLARLPEGALMARAAAGLARRCAQLLSESTGLYGARVHLLVGAGNNGGDALLAGALLAARGVAVSAQLLEPDRADAIAVAALRRAGGRVVDGAPAVVDLIVDGIVGIGATGGLRPAAMVALTAAAAGRGRDGGRPLIVAVDLPSGVDPDTGAVPGPAVSADVTVTFGCYKPALLVGPAAERAGLVDLVDIGLSAVLAAAPALRMADQADVELWWPRATATSDKYSRGVVGIATGSAGFPGAAVLSVAGALAGPVGLVRYAGQVREYVLARHPQVIAAARVAEAGRVQAWVCGSGSGTDERAAAELRAVLAAPVPAVLDADAITLLVDGGMADLLRSRPAALVLTPHDREFARLAGEPVGPDRVASALRLAAWTNAVVLLKGARTVIAAPDGTAWVNPTGTPGLATAGTGDVLAGLLGALLAAGVSAARAAVLAAYAHGLAARRAARDGVVTSLAVAAALPAVVPH